MPVLGSLHYTSFFRSVRKLATDLRVSALVQRIMEAASAPGVLSDSEGSIDQQQGVTNQEQGCNGQTNDWLFARVQSQIEFALALDLSRRPRLSRSGAVAVLIHSRSQANERERNIVLHTAVQWGYQDPLLTNAARQRIARAACRQVAYDFGFLKDLAVTRLPAWYSELRKSITHGDSKDPLSPSHSGTLSCEMRCIEL